jgi:hypothetical protein
MPAKNKIKYNRHGQINQWSIRNQLKIAIQEAINELPVIYDIPNNNVKLPNINNKNTFSNDGNKGFKSRYIL